jgi:hypothetical protein
MVITSTKMRGRRTYDRQWNNYQEISEFYRHNFWNKLLHETNKPVIIAFCDDEYYFYGVKGPLC